MIDEKIDPKELAFLSELDKYENKWVAIVESDGAKIIVGSGCDATEAIAEASGFDDAALLKVFPFDRGYIPASQRPRAC
jgi:hypothetical protein